MTGRKGLSRRRFLKTTAAGALAASSIPTIITPRRAEAYEPGDQPHPNISPLRVVRAQNPRMVNGHQDRTTWQEQERMVAPQPVYDTMDRLAMSLAQEGRAADAWKAIFIKPPRKSWSDVVVAIKTNNIAQQHTRSPVLGKVCHVLTDLLGANGQNIHIYDCCHGGGMSRSTPFSGLPAGVHVADQWGGSSVSTNLPAPFRNGTRQSKCLGPLVRDEVDILVNVALCKGHGGEFGRFTMTLKNHFGTFEPGPGHGEGGGADYVIAINKTPEILGRMDPRTGKVLFPRQQLCIVDALWASNDGPSGLTQAQPNALLMGTFGPVVDYLGAMRFRKDMMGWGINEGVARRFLMEFGFRESDLPDGGRIVDALA
ncbi:MAG: hypothetical protein AMK73_06610 [Planctomycetes bacterium SM23_32]|nr:MAG: hypothetical protein AMK73_06610 [Planctomycetes bacterium SM23_32]